MCVAIECYLMVAIELVLYAIETYLLTRISSLRRGTVGNAA
mgnify:CR=1 FL=1